MLIKIKIIETITIVVFSRMMIRIDFSRERSRCLAKADDRLQQAPHAPIASCCRYTKSKPNIINRGNSSAANLAVIERVVRDVVRLQPADRATFYETPVYIDSPSEFCEAAGLRRCGLRGFFTELPPTSVDLCTNGLLLELYAFSKKENYLAALMNTLCPHLHFNATTISRHVASVRCKFQKLNKSKSRNATASHTYLEQCIECTPHTVIESTVTQQVRAHVLQKH